MRLISILRGNRKVIFWAVLLYTMLPFGFILYFSSNYHECFNVPKLIDGQVDLKGYNFYTGRELLLDGEWEFYYDRWIVSGKEEVGAADMMAPVPASWTAYETEGKSLPAKGKGSYRIVLKNCPGNTRLLVYVPNISSSYRAYINGKLVASRGCMGGDSHGEERAKEYFLELRGTQVAEQSDVEVVIELQSPNMGGLYLTPVLAEQGRDHMNRDMRGMIAAMYSGIMLVSIGCIVCFTLSRDKLLYSAALIVMDIIVGLRFMLRNEFFDMFRNLVPGYHYYQLNTILRIATFYLPVIFLFCMSQLIHIQIRKRIFQITAVYELLLSPILFWCALNGMMRVQFLVCLAGYAPFIYIGFCLYQEVIRNKPYSLLLTTSFFFIMSSVISASLGDAGLLVMNISLFSPGCFVVALLFQLALYIRRSFELELRAKETENLALRLRDSEISLMLSQIQPHFLYNTLTAIHMMCLEEPEAAAETTMKFAAFLRNNMRFIRELKPIPFSQELEHVRNYTDIEEIRFNKRLTLHYDIGATEFSVPALTIQPLVENAIRHGAMKNVEGGNVTIHTFETDDAYWIEVADDGPGFDTKILESRKEECFGISNIMFRLKEQVRAEVWFDSGEDSGTIVHIKIPKEI